MYLLIKSSILKITSIILAAMFFTLWCPYLVAKAQISNNSQTLKKLELFADIFYQIRENYVDEIDDALLIQSALNSALNSLDPHSGYSSASDFIEQKKREKREYGGLGIEVSLENEVIKVNHAIKDGPAYMAGIRTGDMITSVGGNPVKGKTLAKAVEGMRGDPGDPIKLIILKPDDTKTELTVIRQVVRGRAVRHRIESGYGYVYIETFNNSELTEDLIDALNSITQGLNGDLPGLIIDLRGNRGGLLEQSIKVSSLFLNGGEVLSAKGKKPQDTQRYHAEHGELFPDTPIVILINSGSASAAEIVAGALQDRGRAVIVGRRSFGKGSVQSVIPLSEDNGALKITTQRYYTPSGKSIQSRGIMPDVLVARTPDTGEIKKRLREYNLPNSLSNKDDTNFKEVYEEIIYPNDDWNTSDDFQLHKAIQVLSLKKYHEIIEKNMNIENLN